MVKATSTIMIMTMSDVDEVDDDSIIEDIALPGVGVARIDGEFSEPAVLPSVGKRKQKGASIVVEKIRQAGPATDQQSRPLKRESKRRGCKDLLAAMQPAAAYHPWDSLCPWAQGPGSHA